MRHPGQVFSHCAVQDTQLAANGSGTQYRAKVQPHHPYICRIGSLFVGASVTRFYYETGDDAGPTLAGETNPAVDVFGSDCLDGTHRNPHDRSHSGNREVDAVGVKIGL
jgi:hypothetical protein